MNGHLYDIFNTIPERRILSKIRYELIPELRGEIIEVGAGTGATFEYYDRSARVIAIEPDPSMLARAKRRHERNGRIELILGDDSLLDGYPERCVDHVVATLVQCSVGDPAVTMRRFRRIIRTGGTYVFIEHVRADGRLGRIQDSLTPLWRRLAGNCHLNRDFQRSLREAGFFVERLSTEGMSFPTLRLVFGAATLCAPASGTLL